MAATIHLQVESGILKGQKITIPRDGVRIGRSSRNDISIDDPALSRFQCRLYFKPGEGLWLCDLGSANGTLLNGREVQEERVRIGNQIVLGETSLRVISDQETATSAASPAPPAAEAPPTPDAVDLGLRKSGPRAAMPALRRNLLWTAGVMAAVAALAFLPWKRWAASFARANAPPEMTAVQTSLPGVEFAFERVEATRSNIFRYALEVRNDRLVVHVDDLSRDRHVRREKKVSPELLRDLGRSFETSGFFDLLEEYSGLSPHFHETTAIEITLGARTRRVRLVNHAEPESLTAVRTMIEEFGKNELGLAALAIEPAELVIMARDAHLLGRKLHDEREVKYGNLNGAIRSLKEAEWYLETIEPKPDFYADILARKTDYERELQTLYDDRWFVAARAIKLRDWKEAAANLRVICELIPDRSDDRNRNAYKKLVDVERHLSTE